MAEPMQIDHTEVRAYYRQKLEEFGGSARGMDWKNEDSQRLRFQVIAKYMDFDRNPSVLDVGCGNGEFLEFCRQAKLPCRYTGLDIVPEMVALTNRRFGAGTAIEGELSGVEGRYDYVIASGTFNAKLSAQDRIWRAYLHGSIEKMFALCNEAIVFNCMTSHVDYRYDRLYYASPDEISALAVGCLSRRFLIDHSYPLYEMTVAVYKAG